ncbi:HAD hydrolase-like protein [Methanomassiliicoccales archaeon LGM-DZ1]|nr:HAD hydrolase-like protein [Methanomassiliicoccales archaeon LGM-DZ1]
MRCRGDGLGRLVVFDMDGTIADTSAGIFDSYRHTAQALGRRVPDDSELADVIGGALPINLGRKLGLSPEEIPMAVEIYRDYYGKEGYKESRLYPEFREMLSVLKEKGFSMSVATMKAERFAKQLVRDWGLEEYFISVHGVDRDDRVTKPDMIRMCLAETGTAPGDCTLVGDTVQDRSAAEAVGVRFAAVTYGFGYTEDECRRSGIRYAVSPAELPNVIE